MAATIRDVWSLTMRHSTEDIAITASLRPVRFCFVEQSAIASQENLKAGGLGSFKQLSVLESGPTHERGGEDVVLAQACAQPVVEVFIKQYLQGFRCFSWSRPNSMRRWI
jgi:hypothetical protein